MSKVSVTSATEQPTKTMTSTAGERFTPGPWVKDKYGQLRGSNGRAIETCRVGLTHQMTEGTDEALANSALILAAPDIYQALKRISSAPSGITAAELREVARAALAKAVQP